MRSILVVLLLCVASTYATENPLKDIFGSLIDSFKPVISNGLNQLLDQLFNHLKESIGGNNKRDVTDAFEAVFAKLKDLKEGAVDKLTAVMEKFIEKLKNLYPKLIVDYSQAKREVEEEVESVKGTLTETLKNLAKEALEHLKNILGHLATSTLDKVLETLNAKPSKRIIATIKDTFFNLVETLKGHAQNVGNTLLDHGKDVIEKLKPHLDDLKDQLIGHGVNAGKSLVDALANALQALLVKEEALL